MSMDFEWGQAKEMANLKKHRIAFSEAVLIFADPNLMSIFDADHSQKEDRYVSLGRNLKGNVLLVCHSFRASPSGDEATRIISA